MFFTFPALADGFFILGNIYTNQMPYNIVLEKNGPTFSEAFTQYLSDIALEVEAIKLRNIKNDADGVNEHLARIENALTCIMDAKMALAERVLRSQTEN